MDIVRLGFRFSSFVIESEAGLINVVSVSSLAILSPPLLPGSSLIVIIERLPSWKRESALSLFLITNLATAASSTEESDAPEVQEAQDVRGETTRGEIRRGDPTRVAHGTRRRRRRRSAGQAAEPVSLRGG